MLTKTKVLETVKDLPNEFSLEDLMEKLIVLDKIEIGLQQVKDGKIMSTSELKQRLGKWLK